MRRDYEEVKRYREHRDELHEFLLMALITMINWTVAFVAVMGITVMALLIDTRGFSPAIVRLRWFALWTIMPLVPVCILILEYLGRRARDMAYRVRHFSEYESRVKSVLETGSEPERSE
jgi:hypothetical protein